MDLNPVIVYEDGLSIVDARILIHPGEESGGRLASGARISQVPWRPENSEKKKT